ncbi:MAG: lysylphosphatidylglycerol synthase transmembrane domain-containing protein [Bacteroidetes bacterium]|nr:lysylphosphatidylglycerol synthase transmembrane domain-containing protein [Bacteroidota bacterium]
MNWKKALTLSVFFAIGVFLFWKTITIIPEDERPRIWEDMLSAPIWAIMLTFIMGFFAILSRGLRWLLLLEPMGYKASGFRAVCAVAFGYLANTFVPRSGELARCAALNSTDDIPVNKLIGTVITERVVDFIMLFLFMSVALLTNLDAVIRLLSKIPFPDGSVLQNSIIAFVLILLLIIVVFIIKRIIKAESSLQKKIAQFLSGIGQGIKSVLLMKRRIAFVLHTFFIWIMYFLMSYGLFISMDGSRGIGIFESVWVMVSGGVGMVFPAPAGIGSYQMAVELGFQSLGKADGVGLSVGNVVWLTQTGMIIIVGTLGYFFLAAYRVSLKKSKPE